MAEADRGSRHPFVESAWIKMAIRLQLAFLNETVLQLTFLEETADVEHTARAAVGVNGVSLGV